MNFAAYCLTLNLIFSSRAPYTEKVPGAACAFRDQRGRTLAHLAILYWDMPLFKHLISLGIDLGARDADGNTVLEYAQSLGRSRL